MERLDAYPRNHPLNRYPGVGTGRDLGPLVLFLLKKASYYYSWLAMPVSAAFGSHTGGNFGVYGKANDNQFTGGGLDKGAARYYSIGYI